MQHILLEPSRQAGQPIKLPSIHDAQASVTIHDQCPAIKKPKTFAPARKKNLSKKTYPAVYTQYMHMLCTCMLVQLQLPLRKYPYFLSSFWGEMVYYGTILNTLAILCTNMFRFHKQRVPLWP